jgi:hypothetical protein
VRNAVITLLLGISGLACQEPRGEFVERRLALEKEFAIIRNELDGIEARLLVNRQRVSAWGMLRTRHREVSGAPPATLAAWPSHAERLRLASARSPLAFDEELPTATTCTSTLKR